MGVDFDGGARTPSAYDLAHILAHLSNHRYTGMTHPSPNTEAEFLQLMADVLSNGRGAGSRGPGLSPLGLAT